MKNEKNDLGKMFNNINSTSRSTQQDLGNHNKQNSQSNIPSSNSNSSIPGMRSGQGRGWHGDSKGHARAGSQSHKRTGNRHS